jgi:hypothetical protein
VSNPKTRLRPEKPEETNGYIRKNELDDYRDLHLPIPTQVISNEEFAPIVQTRDQQKVEHTILETARVCSARLGIDRRQFLRTSGGMAAAFIALNSVFGELFAVDAAELWEPDAKPKKEYFVFDVQTHHVATGRRIEGPLGTDFFLGLRRFGHDRLSDTIKSPAELEDLYLATYIKEVFLDSETDVAVLTGIPALTEEDNILPPEEMVRTRTWVNEFTQSKRVISHGLFSPDMGKMNQESMQVQAEKLKIEAWKGYTGQPLGPKGDGWWLDDEKIAYPALEYSRKMKIRNICLHKGLPLPSSISEKFSPRDVVKASRDFPDLNFLVYHSGFQGIAEAMPAIQSDFQKPYVPWVSDMCEWRKKNPHMAKNVYMELGSTFALMIVGFPRLAAHVLGMMLQAYGEERVLWGTDSIWWGSPQWQIESFKRMQMPDDLMKRFGYQPLTKGVKAKILGLNAAQVYGVDPKSRLGHIPGDYVDQLRKKYRESRAAAPSNTQYGWVRV